MRRRRLRRISVFLKTAALTFTTLEQALWTGSDSVAWGPKDVQAGGGRVVSVWGRVGGGGERTRQCARTATIDARTLGPLHTRSMATEISCLNVSASHASTMHADYNTNAGARPRIRSKTYARVKRSCRLVRAGPLQVGGACVTRTAPHSYRLQAIV